MNRWIVSNTLMQNPEIINGFGAFIGDLLLRRGIVTMDEARGFFGCRDLSDPMLMSDMGTAVEIIENALAEDKKITIFGDYDCDGITATAILYNYLEAQGADVDYYIPDRSEGYGMNLSALKRIAESGTELVITVDNGISAVEEAEFLKESGIELIITDHHQPGERLPVCGACIDPHRSDDLSPFKDICGAVVVLKLLIALEQDAEFVLESYADLAAVATVCDVMPLRGENRFIVQRGLESISHEQNAGITKLIRSASRDPGNLTATDIAFTVGPRINAAGRMANSDRAVELMLCMDDTDFEKASRIAEELRDLNTARQDEEKRILSDVERIISKDPLVVRQRVIVLSGEGWHQGVVGIVCSKILEKYGKPVVMISHENGEGRGSMRSVEGFSAFKMLDSCKSVLTRYGGHPGAGGFSLPSEKIGEFTELVYKYARENFPKMPDPALYIDKEMPLRELTIENVERLSQLEPFGEGNEQPVFLFRDCVVRSKRALKDGKYVSFEIENGGFSVKVITFKLSFARFFPNVGDKIDVVATADINEYEGRRSVQLKLVDYRISGFAEDRFFAADHVYEEIVRGEGCDKLLAPRVIPQSREELIKIYDLIQNAKGLRTPEELVMLGDVNYCMLSITLDAFIEAGMVELTEDGCPRIVPVNTKTDLFKQGVIARLKAQLES